MAVVFPGAERLGPEEGSPRAIAVYKGGTVAAGVFSTLDIVAAPGYSVTPFDVIAGIDPAGRIVMAECFQCLDCQVEYPDDTRCPPLVLARSPALQASRAPVLPWPAAHKVPVLPRPNERTAGLSRGIVLSGIVAPAMIATGRRLQELRRKTNVE